MKALAASILAAAALVAAAPSEVRIIHADEFTYDGRRHVLLYTGAVEISRGTMHLKADRLEMRLTDDEKRIQEAVATGSVEVRDGDRTGWGDRAVFSDPDGTIVLTGHPRLKDGPSELEADTIVYQYAERRMRAVGNVRGVFQQGGGAPGDGDSPGR